MTDPTQPPPAPYGSAPVPPCPAGAVPSVPQAPPGAYAVPMGGYQVPVGGYTVPPAAPPASPVTGVIALLTGLLAAVVVPLIGGILGYQIGTLVPAADFSTATGVEDLSIFSPARTQILWAEIAFWSGTVLGIAAFVLGIVATVKRRGRGQGIAAIVLAVLGPVFFFGALFVMLAAGGISTVGL
ncbi:hypothetical protein [Microbacterium sp.]|uniref:hypothetical protein n=1 Tax=Microbacterium sp. TaxID=51671 RepID=UPI00281109FE|nr:hypothetical protein [Microbacterium sp.]